MIACPIRPGRIGELRKLLGQMNDQPGVANPKNLLVSFDDFPELHFARLVVLEDRTLCDLAKVGANFEDAPVYLAFLGDCDGPSEALFARFVARAEAGLRQIFGYCDGFDAQTDLLDWMRKHSRRPAANYVNWIGRSVRQVRQEAELHRRLAAYRDDQWAALAQAEPQEARRRLKEAVSGTGMPLDPVPPLSIGFIIHLAGLAITLLLFLITAVVLLPLVVALAIYLRHRERTDPVITPAPETPYIQRLEAIEDYGVTNQFTAFGSVKPGIFRRTLVTVLLWILNGSIQLVYRRGYLARVTTIHFARWVFLDEKRRLLFASNYDGSLESYTDDFINKVAYGLNLVFSNGIGYPRTRYLVFGGAEDEQGFKNYIRRHQLPSDVWYKAYPDLTIADLARNSQVRRGFEKRSMRADEVRAWLRLI